MLGAEEACVTKHQCANATGYSPSIPSPGIERACPMDEANPMVNAGAIATTSLVPGASTEERRKFIRDGLSNPAGREASMNDEVLKICYRKQISETAALRSFCSA